MQKLNLLYSYVEKYEFSLDLGKARGEKEITACAQRLGIRIDDYFRDTEYGSARYYVEKRCKQISSYIAAVPERADVHLYVPDIKRLKTQISADTFERLNKLCTLHEIDELYSQKQMDIQQAQLDLFERIVSDAT